jgi:hypothetical protein
VPDQNYHHSPWSKDNPRRDRLILIIAAVIFVAICIWYLLTHGSQV